MQLKQNQSPHHEDPHQMFFINIFSLLYECYFIFYHYFPIYLLLKDKFERVKLYGGKMTELNFPT